MRVHKKLRTLLLGLIIRNGIHRIHVVAPRFCDVDNHCDGCLKVLQGMYFDSTFFSGFSGR